MGLIEDREVAFQLGVAQVDTVLSEHSLLECFELLFELLQVESGFFMLAVCLAQLLSELFGLLVGSFPFGLGLLERAGDGVEAELFGLLLLGDFRSPLLVAGLLLLQVIDSLREPGEFALTLFDRLLPFESGLFQLAEAPLQAFGLLFEPGELQLLVDDLLLLGFAAGEQPFDVLMGGESSILERLGLLLPAGQFGFGIAPLLFGFGPLPVKAFQFLMSESLLLLQLGLELLSALELSEQL